MLTRSEGLTQQEVENAIAMIEDAYGIELPKKYAAKTVILDAECGENAFLLKRDGAMDTFKNKWELSGGGLDGSEEPHEALRREVMEETGRVIYRPREFGSYVVVHDPVDLGIKKRVRTVKPRKIIIIRNFVSTMLAGRTRISHEHQDKGFFHFSKIGELELAGHSTRMALEHVTGIKYTESSV